MPWLQCSFDVDQEIAEEIDRKLTEWGALAVTLTDAGDQPVLEPGPGETPLWSRVTITVLFAADTDPDTISRHLGALIGVDRVDNFHAEHLGDRVWEREWMKDFGPMQFGRRLWICPTNQPPPDEAKVVVHMDPGLAFGTGTHATTALCLEWLDASDPTGLTVVDYGCGSGILAVAAARLGARRVIAVDNDPQALQATRRNARENGVDDKIEVIDPVTISRAGTTLEVDILLANILAGPLIELAASFATLVAPAGRIVLSGILAEQELNVASGYIRWFDLTDRREKDGWLRLCGQRIFGRSERRRSEVPGEK
jgi:ribosomal protein L11 methyltransferase